MLEIRKDASFSERNIPLGVLEVSYPENGFDRDALHSLIERELAALRERYADYDRKAVFGENPYFRFFRKFKKTYPVMQQFETVMFKGRPFPEEDPVTAVPFLLELTTFVLSGTHDIDRIDGPLTIFTPDAKLPFDGMRGDSTHTYPNDICGRDETGIIFSMIAGADSRTCTYGALGAFSTGVGSTDMAAGMATGMAWFKVPSAIKFVLTGKFNPRVSGKDLILHIIGMIGVDGALYKSMEFTGPGVAGLTMDDRLCICNMAIEAGAKNGIFPVDEVTKAYLAGRSQRPPVFYEADPDAVYEKTIEIDLSALEPTVSYPHLPENTHKASEGKDIKIDQVVIGSCTNGRLEDMEAAYNILKGKHIAKGVRGIIIPATMAVYKECILRGWTTAFIDAGCIVSTPTCGPCLGGYMGILAAGERCVSTTNRNFVGRMGHVDSEVYLASPATAAASALTGYITDPRTV